MLLQQKQPKWMLLQYHENAYANPKINLADYLFEDMGLFLQKVKLKANAHLAIWAI